jgi:hypothetical protein
MTLFVSAALYMFIKLNLIRTEGIALNIKCNLNVMRGHVKCNKYVWCILRYGL